jgi:hypothetical protein
MLPYWILFLFFALGALLSQRDGYRRIPPADAPQPGTIAITPQPAPPSSMTLFGAGLFVLALMIGLRWEVGGQWGSDVSIFEQAQVIPFSQQVAVRDIGLTALNYLVDYFGGGRIFRLFRLLRIWW